MKNTRLRLFLIALIMLSYLTSDAQSSADKEIRVLENMEREAILKGDTATLFKLWSPNYVVNNPLNRIVTAKQIIAIIRQGGVDYTSFNRVIEKITFSGDIAIVMGREITKPEKKTEHAGKTVTRRFTNIWQKNAQGWHLAARQVTNILIQ